VPRHHPNIKALYKTGIYEDALIHTGMLGDDISKFQEPLDHVLLEHKLGQALEGHFTVNHRSVFCGFTAVRGRFDNSQKTFKDPRLAFPQTGFQLRQIFLTSQSL